MAPPAPATPASSNDYNTLKDQFNKVATSKLGRGVAALTALLVPVLTAFCAWFQKKIGIKLDPASLTAFITSMGAGIVLTGYKWLSNHGEWERAMVSAYQVYLTGESSGSHVVIATAPPPAGAGGRPAEP